ncbi:hypothetical protein OEZ86_012785 [Tetradesmus obliquus]|nr:hypothetical protein OEZ86_012785 [Tetradesmus obliquus]
MISSTGAGPVVQQQQQQQQQLRGIGPGLQLVQASCCDVGGVDFGGIVVAVALCTSAGYAAAAITCGQTEMEDAVFIWCAEGSTRSSSSSNSTSHSRQPLRSSSASSAAAPVFLLDCLLPLEDTAASLAWLDTAGLPPLLAVGYASGLLEMYSRDHSGQWNTIACYQAGLSG